MTSRRKIHIRRRGAPPEPLATRLAQVRWWLIHHLPTGLLARPGEWFLAVLCFLSGLTILTGIARSASVAYLLPSVVYTGWGVCLVVGGAGLSCGLSSYRRAPKGWVVTRVPCYRLGLRLLGIASSLYALCLLVAGGWSAFPAASITVAFAFMCGVRLLTLGRRERP